jgi:hypothetical protein
MALLGPLCRIYTARLRREVRRAPPPNHVAVILDGNRRWASLAGVADPGAGHPRIEHCVRPSPLAVAAAAAALALGLSACGGASERSSSPGAAGATTAGEGVTGEAAEALRARAGEFDVDLDTAIVPLAEIESGGPGKDGIPAIDRPSFVPVAEIDYLEPREPVIELVVEDEARAYPIQILMWHEIANDELAGVPVAVTFCPLCNTALVFDRRLDGRTLDFGTTGLLRNSDLVMYDRQTESWWQQFTGQAIVGELAGARLERVPARIVAWEDFRARYSDAMVLSRATGFDRPYGKNPYAGYDDVDSPPWFAAAGGDDDRLAPKERVVYLEAGEEAVAVPFPDLAEHGTIEIEVGGRSLTVTWEAGTASALDDDTIAQGRDVGSASVVDSATGDPVAFDTPFWFAVAAFRPDVRVVRS